MGRYPIHNDTEAALVQVIDEEGKVLRSAEALRGRVEAGDLIAHEPSKGCSATGMTSMWVKPISTA